MATGIKLFKKKLEADAEHHRAMVKIHETELGKESMGAHHAYHKAAIAEHNAAADRHDAMLEECQKAIGDSDLNKNRVVPDQVDDVVERIVLALEKRIGNKLVPDAVSSITPDNPHYQMVPRAGQPAVPVRTAVPIEFEKLVALEDE